MLYAKLMIKTDIAIKIMKKLKLAIGGKAEFRFLNLEMFMEMGMKKSGDKSPEQ